MKKHGFEGNAADCWEKNGGGKFSYKDPLGTGKKSTGRSQRTSAKVGFTIYLIVLDIPINAGYRRLRI